MKNNLDSINRLKEIASGKDSNEFKTFHDFVFKYHMLSPGQRTLDVQSAEAILKIELYWHFPLCTKFIEFMKATGKDHINRDQWTLMIEVLDLLTKGGKYDVNYACNRNPLIKHRASFVR